jgi:pyrroline-5-carboxylate reductase
MTTPLTIGVIGVGHLVRHMMPALVTGGHRFLLSARNRDTAADLSKRFGLESVQDNAEIVAHDDTVIFAVRPHFLRSAERRNCRCRYRGSARQSVRRRDAETQGVGPIR